MQRIVFAAALAGVVILVAWILQKRRWSPPTQSAWHPPAQLDRTDFVDPNKPWLVALFMSHACDSCEKAVSAAEILESDDVAYELLPVEDRPDLHERYRIEQVPLLLIADAQGVVRAQFIGPPSAPEVWGEFAHLRQHDAYEETSSAEASANPPQNK